MTIVDSLHSGHAPDWRIDPNSTITVREEAELQKKFEAKVGKETYEALYKDTMASASAAPGAARTNRSAKDKALYADDSVSKATAPAAMGVVSLYPTSGVPKLANPQNVTLPVTSKAAAAPPVATLSSPTASADGFFNSMKNYFWNFLGWGSTPAGDTSAETPLAGSPKPQVFSERDTQEMAKALELMSIAVNQLITKATEQMKENDSEDGDKEAESIFIKQILSEYQILKELIAAIRKGVTSNELQTLIAADSITKNYETNKDIQNKSLANAEDIDISRKRAEWMTYISYASAGVGGVGLIISIGAAIATAATAGAAAPVLAAVIAGTKVTVAVMGGVASIVGGGATAVKILEEQKTGVRQAMNEALSDIKRMLQNGFKMDSKEQERTINAAVKLQKLLIELAGNKSQLIKTAAYQMAQ